MTPVYAYLRVSGHSQVDKDGFPRQRAAIEAYAGLHSLSIAKWYEEKAVPGKTEWEHRPAWVGMLQAITRNGVKTIVIEKLDRLARDLLVQEHIIADLKLRGVTLLSVAEPDLGSDDPTRKLMRQIMGAIAEYDKNMLVLRMRGARERIKARGESCEGRKPYGHYPAEVAGLKIIRECARYGQEPAAVAARLDAAGIPPRSGGKWHPFAVRRIMERLKA